jgi:hypothetical protein
LPAGMVTTMNPSIGDLTHGSMAAMAANMQPLYFVAPNTHIVQLERPVWPIWAAPAPTVSKAQEDMAAIHPAPDAFAGSMAHRPSRRVTGPVWPLTKDQTSSASPFPATIQRTSMLASNQSVDVEYSAWGLGDVIPRHGVNALKGEMSPSYSVSSYGTVAQPFPTPLRDYTTWEGVPVSESRWRESLN